MILASLSPRRRQLLRMLGIRTEALAPDVPEGDRGAGEPPEAYVERLARAKAEWVPKKRHGYAVLAADTVVFSDGEVLEKPEDDAHALRLLGGLAGRWHEVLTGICVRRLRDERWGTAHERSRVRFAPLDEETIRLYVSTGEPRDKAGAYGIQGYGGLLVERIEGCYFNVMGLPLARLRSLVREMEGTAS
ncbi:MAG: septum formation protein Maf [Candidatus Eisenbacteria bacterium]|nr:septum formation protein Maf [Candidatus Latescibacterota bacterium]MBD3301719.1 septum formation protein Maf [Candidatus Eisenbacteria bacterium]